MVYMSLNRVQVACILMLAALFIVPSLAFPANADGCYIAPLLFDDTTVGWVKLDVSGDNYFLEVEIEDFSEPGKYKILLFKDYYSEYIAGTIEIDEDGDAEAKFKIPYIDPDFQVILRKEEVPEVRSGDWVECEKTEKRISIKVSPSTLNLKSKGNWMTVKLFISPEDEPTEFKVMVNDDEINGFSLKETGNHFTLKISREEAKEHCVEGENIISVSFKKGDETVEVTATIRVIHGENQKGQTLHLNQNKVKSNNGKAKGKN
jgi:hypothetical protein